MDIKSLTTLMNEFVDSKGWYLENSPRVQSARNLAISLNLEASEVLEHFQWTENFEKKDDLASELADVALYLLQLASITGIDLEKAIIEKLSLNSGREWDSQS
ncbi:MAG TPA: MazG-like family protein [Anaerolineales bacterium]|nr:MazG-like family protein [Anaerolineales bacterium]